MSVSALTAAAARKAPDARAVLSKRVVALYRSICRSVPKVLVMYGLEHTVAESRHMVLLHFRKNAGVTDPRIVELLLARADMEVQETMQQWKQKPHVMALLQPETATPNVWLDAEEMTRQFMSGSLTESVVWAGFDQRAMDARTAAVRSQVLADAAPADAEAKEYVRVDALMQQLASPLR